MKRNLFLTIIAAAMAASSGAVMAADVEPGFTLLCDGTTFDGWKASTDHTDTWKIEDGAFVTRGQTAHLFYVGDPVPFTNFDLKVDVMTDHGANGGIYFHTKYQEKGFPKFGFECQVDNTHSDWKKTGSLYDVVNIAKSPAQDNKWWTEEVMVEGSKVTVLIDGKRIFDFNEPPGTKAGDRGFIVLRRDMHGVMDVDAASIRLDRPGAPRWKTAELVNPRISARTITATSAMSPRASCVGLARGCGASGSLAMGRG